MMGEGCPFYILKFSARDASSLYIIIKILVAMVIDDVIGSYEEPIVKYLA